METAPSESAKHRLTFKYSEPTASRLAAMQAELGLKSPLGVIRLAVKVLSYLLKEHLAGWEVVLRKEGREKNVGVIPESEEQPQKIAEVSDESTSNIENGL